MTLILACIKIKNSVHNYMKFISKRFTWQYNSRKRIIYGTYSQIKIVKNSCEYFSRSRHITI